MSLHNADFKIKLKHFKGKILIHPQVLLAISDHVNRIKEKSKNVRNVGALIGYMNGKDVEITSSFAVPYDEYENESSVFYIDADYVEDFARMLNKLNTKEKLVGWYHDGDRILPGDSDIHELFCEILENPLFVIVDLECKENEFPVKAYLSNNELSHEGVNVSRWTSGFKVVPCDIFFDTAEEFSVEHFNRNMHQMNDGALTKFAKNQMLALTSMFSKLDLICEYIQLLIDGQVPYNSTIIESIQNIQNCMRKIRTFSVIELLEKKNCDNMVLMYNSVLSKTIITLNDLLNNRVVAFDKLNLNAEKILVGNSNKAAETKDEQS